MTFSIQRLRNLTTGRLHTNMGDIYVDLQAIFGDTGFMTHMLPNLLDAALPWLRSIGLDARFFDDAHDPSHVGTITIQAPTAADRAAMWGRYRAMPSPLAR